MGRLDKSITGLRNRSRITNKTRIKIIDGDLDEADLIILEEDPEKSKVLDTAGVEHEDARVSLVFLRFYFDFCSSPLSPLIRSKSDWLLGVEAPTTFRSRLKHC
jgi:hypothetical protein